MSFGNILYEEAAGVATLTISRPHRLNALNIDTVHEMIAALGRASADAGVRVVVITGAGDAFCAGADLKDAPDPMTPAVAHEVGGLHPDYVLAIRNVEQPGVAHG